MTAELYWISKTAVVDWPLKLLDGTPASTATVAGVVSRPDGTTAAMAVSWVADDLVWRATYDTTTAGWHAYRLTATGTTDDVAEGTFYVKPSLVGGLPPTLDPTTEIGQVRLLIPDADEDNLIFSDAQITGFLTIEGAVKLAAGQALETIASNEAMVSKVIRTQDLATDGAKLSAELRARAASLRSQHAAALEDADDYTGFEIVNFEPYATTAAELAEWPA